MFKGNSRDSSIKIGAALGGGGARGLAQRPIWRAYQQRSEDVRRWLEEEYPRIRAMARRNKVLIFFGDEAGVRSDHHAGTTWAIKGETPIVSGTGARFGLNLISAVSAQGEFRFMTVKGRVNASKFVEFIKRLIHGVDRMVFLIVDGHPAHKAKMVHRFVDSVKDRFRLFDTATKLARVFKLTPVSSSNLPENKSFQTDPH